MKYDVDCGHNILLYIGNFLLISFDRWLLCIKWALLVSLIINYIFYLAVIHLFIFTTSVLLIPTTPSTSAPNSGNGIIVISWTICPLQRAPRSCLGPGPTQSLLTGTSLRVYSNGLLYQTWRPYSAFSLAQGPRPIAAPDVFIHRSGFLGNCDNVFELYVISGRLSRNTNLTWRRSNV